MKNEELNLYQEIGLRCMRARSAKGWSQQKLADKLGTSPQNISKMEKNGISDIQTIRDLSRILDCNLEEDEHDIEGTIGEVGKEILKALIINQGYMDFNRLLTCHLYGMKEDVANKEILKLSNLGMCVREAYTNLSDCECDGIFITAKGVIAFKNNNTNPLTYEKINDQLKNVVVYEKHIKQYHSYQECLNSRKWEKIIRKLRINSSYRADYIVWLKNKYVTEDLSKRVNGWSDDNAENRLICLEYDWGITANDWFFDNDHCLNDRFYHINDERLSSRFTLSSQMKYYDSRSEFEFPLLLPGKSLPYDLKFRLSMGLNNAELENRIKEIKLIIQERHSQKGKFEKQDEHDVIDRYYLDTIIMENDAFDKNFKAIVDEKETLLNYSMGLYTSKEKLEFEEKQRENYLKEMSEKEDKGFSDGSCYAELLTGAASDFYNYLKGIIEDIKSGKDEHKDVLELISNDDVYYGNFIWLTSDQIERFIDENFHPAETKEEKMLDKELAKLNKEQPSTADYYYQLPLEDDLKYGDRIRQMYCLPSRKYSEGEKKLIELYKKNESRK